jgi:hypothetical protein
MVLFDSAERNVRPVQTSHLTEAVNDLVSARPLETLWPRVGPLLQVHGRVSEDHIAKGLFPESE